MKSLALVISLMSFTAFSATTLEIPATDLIEAVKTISNKIEIEGQLECTQVNTGWSTITSVCVIMVNNNTAVVGNAENIINVVQEVNKPTGPYYTVSGFFKINKLNAVIRAFLTLEE